MDGLARAVGDGISGLVGNSLHTIGDVLGGMVRQVTTTVPGPLLLLVVGGGLTFLVWTFVRR